MAGNTDIVLETRGLYKAFPGTIATNNVSFDVHRQEVHAIIGENGAGKSTLCKLLTGLYQPDRGDIIFMGNKVSYRTTTEAMAAGINMVYQERNLIPHLTGAQNIMLGNEITKMGVILDEREIRATAYKIRDELGIDIPLDMPVGHLSAGVQQSIEIVRAFSTNPKLLILDEPTASLGEKEIKPFLNFITKIKKSMDISIIFISHHLDELMEICDRVSVLRDGQKVSEGYVKDYTVDRIISAMVGKELKNQYPKTKVPIGETLLEVKGLTKKSTFEDISFELHKGEILGLAGLEGCGKNEVIRAVFGAAAYDSGTVKIHGNSLESGGVRKAMDAGIAFVPAERKVDGLFLKQDIAWNMTIASLKQISRGRTLARRLEDRVSADYMERMRVKAKGIRQGISALSGGNQQKVMLARWMMMGGDVFLLEEPTRGIDVNAKTEVYEAIGECVKSGKGIVIVSSEEEEVLGICDKILVMKQGRVTRVMDAKSATTEEIKHYSV